MIYIFNVFSHTLTLTTTIMNDDMKYIDDFIREYKNDNEIKDYIHHNIVPKHMNSITLYPCLRHSKMDETTILPEYESQLYNCDQIIENMNRMKDKCFQMEYKIKEDISKQQNSDKDECPICYENLEGISYIQMKCGHRECFSCNQRKLENKCSLCRCAM